MIHNVAALLRAQFPTETFYVNGITGDAPARCARIDDTGGSERPWTLFGSMTAQVRTRDVDAPKARKFAHDIFLFLTSRFGLILPAATVDGVVYPAVQTGQISATQVPYNLGFDDEGRSNFTCNYQFIRKR